MQEAIEIGYQTFVSDGREEFGAVREVSPNGRPELVISWRMRENLLCPSPQSRRYTRRSCLELRQAGAAASTGDRSRTRCRRA
jgi:hypothetical protein